MMVQNPWDKSSQKDDIIPEIGYIGPTGYCAKMMLLDAWVFRSMGAGKNAPEKLIKVASF